MKEKTAGTLYPRKVLRLGPSTLVPGAEASNIGATAMSITAWIAVLMVVAAIAALIKKLDPKTVLLSVGLFLCVISLQPLAALDAFAKMMTSPTLCQSILSAMGFACLLGMTGCDRHLVQLLVKPLKRLGLLLIPICSIVTLFVNTAIPSAGGCAAAVGATLIPVMMRSGITPVGAAASVLAGTIGSFLNPGSPHQAMIGEYIGLTSMEVILKSMPTYMTLWCISVVSVTMVEFLLGDHRGGAAKNVELTQAEAESDAFKVNLLWAMAPLVPLVVLVLGNTVVPSIRMGIAQAMLVGVVYTIAVTRMNPSKCVNEFFHGCGKGFANIMSIIVSASVFAAGLTSSGLIGAMIEALKGSSEFARWGGILGPWLLGVIMGSGDAATMAFNTSVTPHAPEFGMEILSLGNLAYVAGACGRTMSPIAGVVMVVSGIAMVNPVDVVKRTAPGMLVAIAVLLFFF